MCPKRIDGRQLECVDVGHSEKLDGQTGVFML